MSPQGSNLAYETVIGLEIHVQLDTRSKLFCGCAPRFGDPPNVHTCPVCLGLPGALPVVNERAVEMARLAALALGCRLNEVSAFARKNYFYPDLPKGYQISQYTRPLGEDGSLEFWHRDGLRSVRILRVHLEEDAGKSRHVSVGGGSHSLIDLNRCGTPLIETVTEPDLGGPEEVTDFLETLRATLLYLGITDASMEEGSLRCDANISLRSAGASQLNPKTELKNLNSFRFLRRALRYEAARQARILDEGDVPEQSTRLWDEDSGATQPLRTKEEVRDYRYFADPDLVPVSLSAARLARLRDRVPELPVARSRRLVRELGLEPEEARLLTQERARADLLEATVIRGAPAREAANWIRGPVQAWLNERHKTTAELPLEAGRLAELIGAVADGTISQATGKELLPRMLDEGGGAREWIAREGLQRVDDRPALARVVGRVLDEHPEEAAAYRDGNEKVLGFLMGQVMRHTEGKADPRLARELLLERLGR